MKPSEYYEHQLNEEQLRSDQLQDQIDTLRCQLDDLKAERKELVEVLNQLCPLTHFDHCRGLRWGPVARDEREKDCNCGAAAARKALKKSAETP